MVARPARTNEVACTRGVENRGWGTGPPFRSNWLLVQIQASMLGARPADATYVGGRGRILGRVGTWQASSQAVVCRLGSTGVDIRNFAHVSRRHKR